MLTQLSIPILIEKIIDGDADPYYSVSPIFNQEITASDLREDRATERLTQNLRGYIAALVKKQNHSELTTLSYSPELSRHLLKLELRLKKQTFRGKFFFVVFSALERRIAYCPKQPEVSFELLRGDQIQERATTILTKYYRKKEREEGKAQPEEIANAQNYNLSYIDIENNIQQKLDPNQGSQFFASLGSTEKLNGASELERIGRCINRLYPQQIKRAVMRETLVGEIASLFDQTQLLRPVVLIGPSQVGKTAIIHELIAKRHDERHKLDEQFWLLNPQRMVSGMSYVGQWEERFLAIITHITKKNHVAYFDDLLGLFQAGKSSSSDLSIGNLLKAQLEKNPPRIIAEATPEAWRKLKEIDRGFTDYFQIIPIREPSDDETQRILIRVMQMLETEKNCTFAPGVIPKIMQLQQRYVRSRSFPGKGADALMQLASQSTEITEKNAVDHFKAKSGISWRMIETNNNPDDTPILYFNQHIVGQQAAIDAMVNAITLTKSQLNDPSRPLASLLFLGPTGVGKTECAKALASYVFETEERLLRIDMNEYVGADAAARLIGTEARPHGILTSAIKRQPYTVVLFDEIEKAHPSVFDLLLQVLGEARLTDAAGQTADFSNTLIILTSNLGSAANASHMGFSSEQNQEQQDHIYTQAAEKFFRPEFFNRLDRIVPFHRLDRNHIQGLVQRLAQKALKRFGVTQRKLTLEIEPPVYEMLTDHGFDPEYGARTLRRAVENYLVQPLADALMKFKPSALSTLTVSLDQNNAPKITAQTFTARTREYIGFSDISPDHALTLLECSDDFMDRAEERLQLLGEQDGDFKSKLPYYELAEEINSLKTLQQRLQSQHEIALNPRFKTDIPPRFGTRSTRVRISPETQSNALEKISQMSNPSQWINELAETGEIQTYLAYSAENLINKINHIHFLLEQKNLNIETVILALDGPTWNQETYTTSFPDGKWTDKKKTNHYQFEALAGQKLMKYLVGIQLKAAQHIYQFQESTEQHRSEFIHRLQTFSHTLDLRTGLITDRNYNLWSLITPLLPTAPELTEISNLLLPNHG
ncbi:MAG: AAA family ATPase [Akkermansiaceae bacterium]